MSVDLIANRLPNDDLYPAWRDVDCLEQLGEMTQFEARRWKNAIFRVMLERGRSPDDALGVEAPFPVTCT